MTCSVTCAWLSIRLLFVTTFMVGTAMAQQPSSATALPRPVVRFHHVHLNTTNATAAIDFYTTRFKGRKATFGGLADAVWTGKSWLLFTTVNSPPPTGLTSAIWHIGWGAQDMKSTYRQQLDSSTQFATPLTDISDMVGGSRPFYYAYVDGPDHALIELNTASHDDFGHVHMFSADAPAAGAWYAKHFGWRSRPQTNKRFYGGSQIAPAAFVTADHVSMIIYPKEYVQTAAADQWKNRTDFVSTRGRVVDHLGFSVDHLDTLLTALRADGVTITTEPRSRAGQIRSAFIEGPDHISIELLEDRSPEPDDIDP